jgi:hydroxymethylpyrimidine/phosphomethylpyrimidine kinase
VIPVALTIAGSDPSGGAGLQADLKTFNQHGVHGCSFVTLLTIQNSQAVSAIKILDSDFVLGQLDAVLSDMPPKAAKTGALGNADVTHAIAMYARKFAFPLVVDPVMISKHGAPLIDDEAVDVLTRELVPRAFLVTPNLHEATKISKIKIADLPTMERAAEAIARLGARNVLIKGGAFNGNAVDVLWSAGRTTVFTAKRINTKHVHGSGCVLSAAITANLACDCDIISAVGRAKKFISVAIRTNPGLGSGCGPVNMQSKVQ